MIIRVVLFFFLTGLSVLQAWKITILYNRDDTYANRLRQTMIHEIQAGKSNTRFLPLNLESSESSLILNQAARFRPHLIIAIGDEAFRFGCRYFNRIPTVFVAVSRYLIDSTHKTIPRLTGIIQEINPQHELELISQIRHDPLEVFMIYPEQSFFQAQAIKKAATARSIPLSAYPVQRPEQIEIVLRKISPNQVLWVLTQPVIYPPAFIQYLLHNLNKPEIITYQSLFADQISQPATHLTTLVHSEDLGEQAAHLVLRMLDHPEHYNRIEYPRVIHYTVREGVQLYRKSEGLEIEWLK